jgi:hypothetical protein
MLISKSNTFFEGYLDQFHIHAGVSYKDAGGAYLKEFIRAEEFERRALADTDRRTAGPAPNRAMVTYCIVCRSRRCLDNTGVNNSVWLAFVLEIVPCARFFPCWWVR